jgi:hypothetical protein
VRNPSGALIFLTERRNSRNKSKECAFICGAASARHR